MEPVTDGAGIAMDGPHAKIETRIDRLLTTGNDEI